MRAFIAIELPQEIKDALARLQADLKKSEADVKWVKPGNIHLTLKFLGEIDQNSVLSVTGALQEACRKILPFTLALSSLGAFPKINFPRVIWIGVGEGDKETKNLAKALEEELVKIGIPREDKAFSTHITIGRVRSAKNNRILATQLQTFEDYLSGKTKEVKISKITFFKSTLTPCGPLYEALQEIALATT